MPRTDMLIPTAGGPSPQAARRMDGWNNAVSNLGTKKDKRRHLKYTENSLLDKSSLVSQYTGDGLVRRIIDALPEDMTREWGYFENDEDNDAGQGTILSEMLRLDAPTHFREALKWARLLGGSLIFIGAMDGKATDKPLDPAKIKTIEFLKVFDLGDIYTNECKFNDDLSDPNFGKIELYKVRVRSGMDTSDVWLHASRCIPVYGTRAPLSSSFTLPFENRHWGIPIMQFVYDDLRDYRGVFGSTAAILNEFIVGKFKFSDLDEMLATGNEKALQTRIDAIDQTKSLINSVILGTDEDYIRDSATVTGIADLLDRFMMNLSSVTGIPVTKLFGRSASGLNATGEGDSKNYYDTVRSQQNELTPYIQQFGKIIADWKNVSEEIQWKWNPLFQLTEEQRANKDRIEAENVRTLADADQRYIDTGVLTPEEVYKMRFEAILGPKEFEEYDPMEMAQLQAQMPPNGQQPPPNGQQPPPNGEQPPVEKEPGDETPDEKAVEEEDDKRNI